MQKKVNTLIIGGGAAGFFSAINLAERDPKHSIAIVERGKRVLNKVKIAGGGRCNVTHAEFDPRELSRAYPRGERELLGPFHRFMTGDTMDWFEKRGVPLKIEEDGRIFPVSNDSQSVIDCLIGLANKYGIDIYTRNNASDFFRKDGQWLVQTKNGKFQAENLILCPGGSPKIWKKLESLGHQIVPPVPSLFTFNCKDERIQGLAGVSTQVEVRIPDQNLSFDGPLLITHWGFSGPAILKLSAWGARQLNSVNYQFKLNINWVPAYSKEKIGASLQKFKTSHGKKHLFSSPLFKLPKRLWQNLVCSAGIGKQDNWGDLNKVQLQRLTEVLHDSSFSVQGKSTFKEEFVTAGGVELSEVNFRTFGSKLQPNLYFAGEVLNIDAITGGFNFQNAWTGGYIIAKALSKKNKD